MYRAVLDTCALVPGRQRDFLLQLAAEYAYTPLWGTGILFELNYVLAELHEERDRPDDTVYRQQLFTRMAEAFPDSTIDAPKDRRYHYALADADDGHVAHAALIGKADAIVTDDTRAGFPTAPDPVAAGVEIMTPAQFAAEIVSADPQAGVETATWERVDRHSHGSLRGRSLFRQLVSEVLVLPERRKGYGVDELLRSRRDGDVTVIGEVLGAEPLDGP